MIFASFVKSQLHFEFVQFRIEFLSMRRTKRKKRSKIKKRTEIHFKYKKLACFSATMVSNIFGMKVISNSLKRINEKFTIESQHILFLFQIFFLNFPRVTHLKSPSFFLHSLQIQSASLWFLTHFWWKRRSHFEHRMFVPSFAQFQQ